MAGPANPTKTSFRFELLDKKKHNRAAFSCGQESLDRYLKEHASQEIKKQVTAVYVLTPDGKTIAGYYTLSQYAIEAGELPQELMQKLRLSRYDRLPATLLGRLGRNVVVDAIDENAREFYQRYGFIDVPGHPNRLFHSDANHKRSCSLLPRELHYVFDSHFLTCQPKTEIANYATVAKEMTEIALCPGNRRHALHANTRSPMLSIAARAASGGPQRHNKETPGPMTFVIGPGKRSVEETVLLG